MGSPFDYQLIVQTDCSITCNPNGNQCDINIVCSQTPTSGKDEYGADQVGYILAAQQWSATLNGSVGTLVVNSTAFYTYETVGLEFYVGGGGSLGGVVNVIWPPIQFMFPVKERQENIVYNWTCDCKT